MKKIIIFIIGIILISFIVSVKSCDKKEKYEDYEFLKEANSKKYEALQLHWKYYDAVENLLDKLDSAYDWVDAFDPYEYYEAKYKLDSLYKAEM